MKLSDESIKRIVTAISEEMGVEFGQAFTVNDIPDEYTLCPAVGFRRDGFRENGIFEFLVDGEYYPVPSLKKGDLVYILNPTLPSGVQELVIRSMWYSRMLFRRGLLFYDKVEAVAESIKRGWREETPAVCETDLEDPQGILVKTNQSCLKINQELGNEMVKIIREELSRVGKEVATIPLSEGQEEKELCEEFHEHAFSENPAKSVETLRLPTKWG